MGSEEQSQQDPAEATPTQPQSDEEKGIGEATPEPSPTPEQEQAPTEEQAQGEGILVGTESEQAPGVGGTGDHPAPAAVRDPETGDIHVAGEPPTGLSAGTAALAGDQTDVGSGDIVTDPEARERLNAVTEPDQVQTDRPDIGTPTD